MEKFRVDKVPADILDGIMEIAKSCSDGPVANGLVKHAEALAA